MNIDNSKKILEDFELVSLSLFGLCDEVFSVMDEDTKKKLKKRIKVFIKYFKKYLL